MFKTVMQPLLVALGLLLSCYSYSSAQVTTTPTQTSPDLLEPDGSKWSGNFGTGYWGGSQQAGPPCNDPNLLPSTTTFNWGCNATILSTTIAINSALQVAGIQVNGFEYEWKVKNGNANIFGQQPGIDDFVIEVDIYDAQGNLYATYQYDYSYSHNWTTHSGQELFQTPFLPPSYFDRVEISAQGQDVGNWQGWYGPEFNVDQSSFSVIFSANPCYQNPLYDPQCPGYANALFQQQCTINPLFDPTCSGYFTAQCNMNPLYDPACPGYTTANFTQQCNNDPTSDPACPDYYVAMCEEDPLYDMGCVGYDTAYFNKECSMDAQYDAMCPGYVDLSGNDDAVVILDPVIDDVVNVDIDENFYKPEDIPVYVPEFEYTDDGKNIEADTGTYEGDMLKLEDDIEKEIAQLEKEEAESGDGAFNMEDDIENEIKQLEETTSNKDFDDPTNTGGEGNMEDDIEKEIAALESQEDSDLGDEKQVESDGKEESNNNAGPDTLVGSDNKNDERKVVPNKSTTSRRDKMRMLIAQKAIETTRELEQAVSLEQQMEVQRRLLALISYVPDFKDEYTTKEVNQINFYPPKPTIDHAFARWFLNDPNFAKMENLQYD